MTEISTLPDTPFQRWLEQHEACHIAREQVGATTFTELYHTVHTPERRDLRRFGALEWWGEMLDLCSCAVSGRDEACPILLIECGDWDAFRTRMPLSECLERMNLKEGD